MQLVCSLRRVGEDGPWEMVGFPYMTFHGTDRVCVEMHLTIATDAPQMAAGLYVDGVRCCTDNHSIIVTDSIMTNSSILQNSTRSSPPSILSQQSTPTPQQSTPARPLPLQAVFSQDIFNGISDITNCSSLSESTPSSLLVSDFANVRRRKKCMSHANYSNSLTPKRLSFDSDWASDLTNTTRFEAWSSEPADLGQDIAEGSFLSTLNNPAPNYPSTPKKKPTSNEHIIPLHPKILFKKKTQTKPYTFVSLLHYKSHYKFF